LLVINHQQHVSAIKAIFGLNAIIMGNLYYNTMNVTDKISPYIKWRYDTLKCAIHRIIPLLNVRRDLICNIHGNIRYISYYDRIQPEDGFYSLNILLMVNYKVVYRLHKYLFILFTAVWQLQRKSAGNFPSSDFCKLSFAIK